jgi:hypothetical protein
MSNYSLPAALGSSQGTGAYSEAIAAQVGTVNNNGNLTDSAGNIAVDFAFGPLPMQPNDERAAAVTPANFAADSNGDYDWAGTTRVASGRLDPALDNHANVEAKWAGFPDFIAAPGNYMVTAVSGNGTTVTYTSQNELAPGDVVNITGLTASAYNLSSATVVTADKLKFTVTNSANAGELTGQWYGKVQLTTAATAADGAGIGNIVVPNVLGFTTAVALDALLDAGYETARITTATAATNSAGSITDIDRTAGSTTVELTGTGFTAAYPVGTKITVASTGTVDGTWTVTGNTSTNKIRFTSNASTVLTSGTGSIIGVEGTIRTQSTAAGTGSVATTATITITPWAAAS